MRHLRDRQKPVDIDRVADVSAFAGLEEDERVGYCKAYEANPQSTYALVNIVSLRAARNTEEDREKGIPRAELEKARLEGTAEDVRLHLRKDGARVFIDGKVSALRKDDGRLIGAFQNVHEAFESQEVSAAMLAERLKKQRQRHRPDWFLTHDRVGVDAMTLGRVRVWCGLVSQP